MAERKTHVYRSTTLGMPPLQMVLVHARNEAQNAARRSLPEPLAATPAEEAETPLQKQQAVRKIIHLLESMDQ